MNWEFWGEHWFLAWSALWLVWGVIWLPVAVVSILAKLVNRILRTIKVACRGWPPSHLDADEDWCQLPQPGQRTTPNVEANRTKTARGEL